VDSAVVNLTDMLVASECDVTNDPSVEATNWCQICT
jgi:hypothetical protein